MKKLFWIPMLLLLWSCQQVWIEPLLPQEIATINKNVQSGADETKPSFSLKELVEIHGQIFYSNDDKTLPISFIDSIVIDGKKSEIHYYKEGLNYYNQKTYKPSDQLLSRYQANLALHDSFVSFKTCKKTVFLDYYNECLEASNLYINQQKPYPYWIYFHLGNREYPFKNINVRINSFKTDGNHTSLHGDIHLYASMKNT